MAKVIKSQCKFALLEQLKKSVHVSNAFSEKNYIFTASNCVSSVLKHQLICKNFPYLMGVEFIAFSQWAKVFLSQRADQFLLSKSLMEIAITQELKRLVVNETFKDLESFLQGENNKLLGLSQTLTNCFLFYGLFAKDSLENWEKKQGWQQEIWQRISEKYPALTTLLQNAPSPENLSLHLYMPSFLPEPFVKWLLNLSGSNDVTLYLFSPCGGYWEDTLSSKVKYHVLTQKNITSASRSAFDSITRDAHPLLSSWGHVIKELHKQLEECIEEVADPIDTQKTLLNNVCSEIYAGVQPSASKLDESADGSLSIHVCANVFRECECLLENLIKLYQSDSSLLPDEICILCSQVPLYAPSLQLLCTQLSLPFSFSYDEMPVELNSLFLQNFDHFLSLLKNPFSIEDLQMFFQNPFFLKQKRISAGDAKRFFRIVTECGLPKSGDTIGNLRTLCERLLQGLASVYSLDSPFTIELTYAEELGDWISWLHDFCDVLQTTKQQHSPKKWAQHILSWVDSFFSLEGFSKEAVFYEDFCSKVGELRHLKNDEPISFRSSTSFVQSLLTQKKQFTPSTDLPVLTISSFSSQGLFPCKHLFLLGCSDQHLAKNDHHSSLNELLYHQDTSFFPSRAQVFKTFFLEALFTPKRSITLSHPLEENFEATTLSTLLKELLNYLDHTRRILNKKPSSLLVHEHLVSHAPLLSSPKPKAAVSTSIPLDPNSLHWNSWIELSKHPIRCFCRYGLNISTPFVAPTLAEEEIFISYLKRSSFKEYCKVSSENAFNEAKSLHKFPEHELFKVAQWELQEQQKVFEENASALGITTQEKMTLVFSSKHHKVQEKENHLLLPPLTIDHTTHPVTIEGNIPNVLEQGLVIYGKSFEALAKNWGLILLWLKAPLPSNFSKNTLLLIEEGKALSIKIDIEESIKSYYEYLIRALQTPSFTLPSLIKHIQEKPEQLLFKFISAQQTDPLLKWYIDHNPHSLQENIEHWSPQLVQVYSPLHSIWEKN